METVLIRLGRQLSCPVDESSGVAAARRAGAVLAERCGFDEVRGGQLALLITEAATNILKHADIGEILLRPLYGPTTMGVELLVLDQGPGIADVELEMRDGQSNAGSYGVGLGAMARLSQAFDIYSLPDQGTAIRLEIWSDGHLPDEYPWQLGAVCLPLPGEELSGDDWAAQPATQALSLMVADGLGHGPFAATASQAATALLSEGVSEAPGLLLQRAHGALHGTRGAAVAIARIDAGAGELRYAGVGNIAASVFNQGEHRHLLSHNGIVGSNMTRVQEFTLPWTCESCLIMHSDGIGSRWNLEAYPGLLARHPSLVAAVLYRDHSRRRDDVSVVVARQQMTGT